MSIAWELLIDLIDEGRVVPVVGQDLAHITVGGRTVAAYDALAERLAQRLGIDIEPSAANAMNCVVMRYLEKGGDSNELYYHVKKVADELERVEVPPALIQLAQIRPLRLFVTTTFDSLLQRAVNAVRYGGDDVARVRSVERSRSQDISEQLVGERVAIIFHLFGRAVASPDFAVTEEDTLEWMQLLQSDKRPEHLLQLLAGSDLLLIGNSFDDWLARFFIRTLKQQRLWVASSCSGFVADDRIRNNGSLLGFLRRSPHVKVFTEGTPVDFVAQLHRMWTAKHPDLPPGESGGGTGFGIEPGAVFVSYASDDESSAKAIVDALTGAGLDVWWDQRELAPGDGFDAKIEYAIRQSAVFIPIISAACRTDHKRFFRREWSYADDVAREARITARFIEPVVVDDTPYDDPDVPKRFRDAKWLKLPASGEIPEEWVEQVRQTVRAYRRAGVRRSA